MPRKPRIEYEDAIYHVMNRGNYRYDIFLVEGSGEVFEKSLFEACGRFGWVLHAYVAMSNHYHLALQTPDANLVKGMQWFQSTFGNRFNRLVRQRGHIFQGRYKALLIESNHYLFQVVNYIHLNPVRANIVEIDRLRTYPLSSYPKFFQKNRPVCLQSEDWLALAGDLKPTGAGMRCYHRYLKLCHESNPEKQNAMYVQLCRGWYIGTKEGKKALLKEVSEGSVGPGGGIGRFGDAGGEVLLAQGLLSLGKTNEELITDGKCCEWKVVLASWIKSQCGISNQWLSGHLHMGSMYAVSRLVAQENRRPKGRRKLWRKLQIAKR
ncbi:MAG: transposase [Planctomycetota bacterium]|nr:transposase [Planctomycetota bacterium]